MIEFYNNIKKTLEFSSPFTQLSKSQIAIEQSIKASSPLLSLIESNNAATQKINHFLSVGKTMRLYLDTLELQKSALEKYNFSSFWSNSIHPIFTDNALLKAIQAINASQDIASRLSLIDSFSFVKFDLDELVEDEEERKVVVDDSGKLKHIITDIYKDNSKILTIDPRHFEELIAELLFSKGFEVELTQQTRDGGFDIIGIKKITGFYPLKFLVECKRYSKNVGVEIVRSFKNVLDEEKANRGIIATTAYFTKEAVKKKNQYPHLLEFKDRDAIIEWVGDYYKEKILRN